MAQRVRVGWIEWKGALPKAHCSLTVAAITLIVGIVQAFLGRLPSPISLPDLFGVRLPDVLAGQWWRPFTWSIVSELGIPHAVTNAAGILAVGVPLERAVGARRWLATFFVASTAAFTAEVIGPGPLSLLAGGSGGLLGLAGLAIAWRPRLPSGTRFVAIVIVILTFIPKLTLGWLFPPLRELSDWAHAGGLTAGLFIALLSSRSARSTIIAAAATLAVSVLVLAPMVPDSLPATSDGKACDAGTRSEDGNANSLFTIVNRSGHPIRLYWVRFRDRALIGGHVIPSDRLLWQNRVTFETGSGTSWIVADPDGRCLATATVESHPTKLIVGRQRKGDICSARLHNRLRCEPQSIIDGRPLIRRRP